MFCFLRTFKELKTFISSLHQIWFDFVMKVLNISFLNLTNSRNLSDIFCIYDWFFPIFHDCFCMWSKIWIWCEIFYAVITILMWLSRRGCARSAWHVPFQIILNYKWQTIPMTRIPKKQELGMLMSQNFHCSSKFEPSHFWAANFWSMLEQCSSVQ